MIYSISMDRYNAKYKLACMLLLFTSLLSSLMLVESAIHTAAGCVKSLPARDSMLFSGHGGVNNHDCNDICAAYNDIDIKYNQSIFFDKMCFCTNTTSFDIPLPPKAPCYGFAAFTVKLLHIITSGFISFKPTKVIVLGLPTNLEYLIYDFGDGSIYNKTQDNMKHTYISSGYHLLAITMKRKANDNLVKISRFVYIANDIPLVTYQGPRIAIHPFDFHNLSLTFIQGSDMTVQISQVLTQPEKEPSLESKELFSFDVAGYTHSSSEREEIGASGASGTSTPTVFIGRVGFKSSGILTALNMMVKKPGTLKICVLSLKCSSCGEEIEKLSLLESNNKTLKVSKSDVSSVLVTSVILIELNGTGNQELSLKAHSVSVKKGDEIGFLVSDGSAQIAFAHGEGLSFDIEEGHLQPEKEETTLSKKAYIPYYQALIVSPESYGMNISKFRRGNVTFVIDEVDSNTSAYKRNVNNFTVQVEPSISHVYGLANNVTFYIPKGRTYFLVVQVIKNSEVTFEVDFYHPLLTSYPVLIKDASDALGPYVFPFAYGNCLQEFYVSLKASRVMASVSKLIRFQVLCHIKGVDVLTSPKMNSDEMVKLSVDRNLTVQLTSDGSLVSFNISWGDGITDTYEQTQTYPVGKFTFQLGHKYEYLRDYNVDLLAWNKVSNQTYGFVVRVQNCSEPPAIIFQYGTSINPVVYKLVEDIELYAGYTYPSEECKILAKKNTKWGKCRFNTSSNYTPLTKENEKGVMCFIEKAKLNAGRYAVVLPVTYGEETFEFYSYINLTVSPLVAIISNGAHQVIPQKKKNSAELPAESYTFVLDGRKSQDPDTFEEDQGLTYVWSCQIQIENTSKANSFCNSSSWKVIRMNSSVCLMDTPSATLKINSSCIQLNASYVFMLNVTKRKYEGDYSATATQIVESVEGDPPIVKYTCDTNCLEKVNVNEKMIRNYECDSCFGRKFNARWTVTEMDTKETTEIKAFDQPNLIVGNSELKPGKTYEFSVALNYIGSSAYSKVIFSLDTSQKPLGGTCAVSPLEGEAVKTKFSMSCEGWLSTDEDDQPKFYEFHYELNDGTGNSPLMNPSSLTKNNVLNVLVPAGLEKNDYEIQLRMKIINKYGDFAEWTKSKIKVKPPSIPSGGGSGDGEGGARLDGLFNDILNNEPKDLTDAEAVTGLVTSGALVLNSLKPGVVPTLEPAPAPGVFGDLDLNTGQKEREKAAKEKETKEKAAFKEKMLNMMGKIDVKNVQQAKAAFDSIAALTDNKDEVNENAADGAVNLLFNMKDKLKEMAKSGKVGANYMKDAAKNYGKSISNLFAAGSEKPVDPKSNKTANPKVEKNTKKLLSALDSYADVLASTQAVGEGPSEFRTPEFAVSVQKTKLADMANMSITVDESGDENEPSLGFALPNMTSQFGDVGDGVDFSIQSVTYRNNVFSWGNGSNKIKSEVPSLSIKTGDSPMNVSNTPEPIVVNIKNKPEDMTTRNVSLFMPGDLMFNKTQLASENCNMILNFDFVNDPENLTQFIVYIQYGKVASKSSYDVKLNMSNAYGMIMTVATDVPPPLNFTGNKTYPCNYTYDETQPRNVYARKVNNRTILLWNFTEFFWANPCRQLHFTFQYAGPMPKRIIIDNPFTFDAIEYRGAYNYSVRSSCGECSYWNKDKNDWTSDGCALNPEKTTAATTSCQCNHLTSFGGVFVAPNELKTVSLGSLKQGFVLLLTVLILLMIYIICLVIARRADKRDGNRIGLCPLVGNDPNHQYMYQVTVDTGSQRSAGTTSNVYCNVVGSKHESGFRHLTDPERLVFQPNNSDVFVMSTESCLGDLDYIRIWHDNDGGGWYLRSIKLIDLQTDEEFFFQASRWLAVDKFDGMVDCILPITSTDEMSGFSYLFSTHSTKGLSDNHIWFSIYSRPTRSSFTRCQRVSVAFSLLFCSMLSSCMFYESIPAGAPEDENRFAGFSFRWEEVYVVLICIFITVPINLLLGSLFRSINPNKSAKSSHSHQTSSDTALMDSQNTERPSSPKRKKKEKMYLPHWFLYIAWFLCIAVMLACCVMVIWYGMIFGNQKSLAWLASVTAFMIVDVVLVQPTLVFLFAVIIALLIRTIDDGIQTAKENDLKSLLKDDTWLNKFHNSDSIFTRMDVPDPPDSSNMANMREIRLKELKMAGIVREIMFYILYIMLVMAIGFNFRDQNAYHQTVDVKELLRLSLRDSHSFQNFEVFENIQSYQNIWDWVDYLLLAQTYPSKWYELSDKYKDEPIYNFPGKIFLNDLNSKIVNGVRLRQMRVQSNSCDVESNMQPIIKIDCADHYTRGNKDTGNYYYNWNKPLAKLETATNPLNKPWRYLDSSELDTYTVAAQLHSYSGGGYVLEIFPKFNNQVLLNMLKKEQWIDRHTRALIIEFATYNAQSNFFNMVFIVFEFPPGGGVVHYHSVETFRLEMYTKQTAFFVITTYVLYLIFMLIFSIREAKVFYRVGFSYFGEFWNLVEFAIVALSILSVTLFFYLGNLRKVLFARMPHKVPNVFINFQEAAIWYDYMIHAVALICFFVTVKLIKMLRFNQRVSLLSATLNSAWHPLAMFAIMFFVIIGSVVFSTTIIFGHTLYGYRNWFATLSSVFGLLLGKFSYEQFETTNHNLGPPFFFAFNIFVNWIVMNMFITILTDVFSEVQAEMLGKPNEYEIVDYMTSVLKGWMGMGDTSLELVDNGDGRMSSRASSESHSLNSCRNSNIFSSSLARQQEKLFNEFDDVLRADDELNPEYVNEAVSNFVKCLNIIYFHQEDSRNTSIDY